MAFGYEFVDLDSDQKHTRRVLLEWYPMVAQWSVLVPCALFQLAFFLSWLARGGLEYERPRSPSFSKHLDGKLTWLKRSKDGFQKARWWMKKEVVSNWGTRGEWIFGGIWTVWLLWCSVVDTGNDYLHLTKRLGIIGASQLPLQYLLAMRSPYSPLQYITRLSHEELKASHQILGRIINLLFVLHAVLYFNFFIVSGFIAKRIKDKDVILGTISIILFAILSTTALGYLRRLNYRVFFISHITIANLVIVTLFFHVSHIRIYIYEVVVINAIHLILRGLALKIRSGTVRLLPGTNLVQIRIPLTAGDSALHWKPGQHVYLSRPLGKPYSDSFSDQMTLRNQTNPFTIASIPAKDHELVLVAKTLNGNTKQLAELAKSLSAAGADGEDGPSIALALEGPYGSSTRLPDFSTFDNILLVAGGVGATFIMPVYRSIIESNESIQGGSSHVRFVWAVRKLAETQWAIPTSEDEESESDPSTRTNAVEVYITQPLGPNLQTVDPGDDIEMAEDEQLLSMEEQVEKPRKGMVLKSGRPSIPGIVDDTFSKGTRVAVIACGPKMLTEQLAECVEQWVGKGSDIYWHNETFGW